MRKIDIDAIRRLREITGASLVECKKALTEANFDLKLAISNVRSNTGNPFSDRSDDSVRSGIVLTKISGDCMTGVILKVGCETDFVARTEVFRSLSRKMLDLALEMKVDHVEHLHDRFEEELIRLSKKVGEKLKPVRLGRLSGGRISSYVHRDRIGVLLSTRGCEKREVLRSIAMHIAASEPACVSKRHTPDDLPEKHREEHPSSTQMETDTNVAQGRDGVAVPDRFSEQVALLEQKFIFDARTSVEQFVKRQSVEIDNFLRFEIRS